MQYKREGKGRDDFLWEGTQTRISTVPIKMFFGNVEAKFSGTLVPRWPNIGMNQGIKMLNTFIQVLLFIMAVLW